MLAQQLAAAIGSAHLRTLDDLSRDVWRGLVAGMLTDDEAHGLAEAIHARRMKARGESQPSCSAGKRAWSYFPPKRAQRTPDRVLSLERRRRLAASGPLPPQLASGFTTGELAALRIVTDEVRRCGQCTKTLPEIAARAGVSVSTARNAIREASRGGLLTVEERRQHCRPNLANVVRIVSQEWLAWLSRRGGFKKIKATDTVLSNRLKRSGWNSSPRSYEGRRRPFLERAAKQEP